MGILLKEWSPLLAAVLVVLSVLYTGMTIRTHTESMQGKLTVIEKTMDSIRNAIEGNQGVIVRIATLDVRMGDTLQSLMTQRDRALAHDAQASFNIHDELQSLKHNVDALLNMTQGIEYIEELILDIQGIIEDMKQQQNKASQ